MQPERFLHLIDIRAHLREIESHDEKLVMYRRRMLPDIQIAEQFVELVGIPNVIISLQHCQRQTFPEAPGTDQEQIRRLHFYLFDKHRLIHIIIFCLRPHIIGDSNWKRLRTSSGISLSIPPCWNAIINRFFRIIKNLPALSILHSTWYLPLFTECWHCTFCHIPYCRHFLASFHWCALQSFR